MNVHATKDARMVVPVLNTSAQQTRQSWFWIRDPPVMYQSSLISMAVWIRVSLLNLTVRFMSIDLVASNSKEIFTFMEVLKEINVKSRNWSVVRYNELPLFRLLIIRVHVHRLQTKFFFALMITVMVGHVTSQMNQLVHSAQSQKVFIHIEVHVVPLMRVSRQVYHEKTGYISDIMLSCGSFSPYNNECEIYKINGNKWQSIGLYPFD